MLAFNNFLANINWLVMSCMFHLQIYTNVSKMGTDISELIYAFPNWIASKEFSINSSVS